MPMNVSFLQELLGSIAEQGRQLLPKALVGSDVRSQDLDALAKALMSGRGEASGVAIASEILARYREADADRRRAFYRRLAEEMKPDEAEVKTAVEAYATQPSPQALGRLRAAVESPRQEFFRRLNLAPGATAEIIGLRKDLLRHMGSDPSLHSLDEDLRHLLGSWFNRGFLVLRRIDWQTPASILEKIIAYEAVHAIRSWDELRRRLDPTDRRCYAFFHPSLIDEPLIFVEVALTSAIPGRIVDVLGETSKDGADRALPRTAVFYSISNCQEGLRGISFGNFLIKQVAEDLARELPSLDTFVTLSPVPTFARWLDRVAASGEDGLVTDADRETLRLLRDPGWHEEPVLAQKLEGVLVPLAAHYFLNAMSADGRPIDPVARFHLGNGARLERINWLGDMSEKGLREAHGIMVNYLYDLGEIEKNHEAFANEGQIVASKAVRNIVTTAARKAARARSDGAARLLALPRRVATGLPAPASSTTKGATRAEAEQRRATTAATTPAEPAAGKHRADDTRRT